MVNREVYSKSKTAPTEEEGKSSGRSIWTEKECRRAFDGKVLLNTLLQERVTHL